MPSDALVETTKTTIDPASVEIKPLDSKVSRAAFCCGVERIDNFFRYNAKDHHLKHKARVYVGYSGTEIVGYYYLVAMTHNPEEVSTEAYEKFGRVKHAPCVYLGMIGVDRRFQGQRIGELLMVHAMRQTAEVAEIVGLYALTLEAIDERTALLYEKYGFHRFTAGGLQMFIPLSTIKLLFQTELHAF